MEGSGREASEPTVSYGIEEHLYKVLVIGDFGVGKTSIIKRYTEGTFSPNYKLTIGVDFSLKTLEWDARTKVNLQLWDIAGHERFNHMTRVYYKYAIAAIIVFDLQRLATFESVLKWLTDLNQKVMLENGGSIPIIILANKCDLENHQVDQATLDAFWKTHNVTGWFPTSAKEDTNIDEAMNLLVCKILELSSQRVDRLPEDYVDLTPEPDTLEELAPVAGHAYQHSSRGLTGILPPKPHPHPTSHRSKGCC